MEPILGSIVMRATRRDLLATTMAGGAVVALGGCEKLVSKVTARFGQSIPDTLSPPAAGEIDPIHHLLNRAGFGPWPGDVEHVRGMGAEAWIDQQLEPSSIDDGLCDLRPPNRV